MAGGVRGALSPEREWSRGDRAKTAAKLMVGWVALLWLLEVIDVATGHSLDEFGIVVIAGDAFGDDPAALTIRVAVPGIYGESDSERLAALLSNDPLEMPWIAETLDALRDKLKALVS